MRDVSWGLGVPFLLEAAVETHRRLRTLREARDVLSEPVGLYTGPVLTKDFRIKFISSSSSSSSGELKFKSSSPSF